MSSNLANEPPSPTAIPSAVPTVGTVETGRARRTALILAGILVVLDLSYVLNAMDRQVFPVLVPPIRAEYGFSLAQAGVLATVFTLGIGLVGLPAGFLIDRYHRKHIVLAALMIFSAATLLQTVALSFTDFTVYRVLSGVGEGVQNASLFAALGALFPRRRALALGTLTLSYGLGGFLGPLVGAWIYTTAGSWRAPLWAYGGAGLVILLVVAILVPVRSLQTEPQAAEKPATDLVRARLFNRNAIACAVTCGVIGLSIYSYVGLYPSFLESRLHFTAHQAGLAASMFGLGSVLGVAGGWLGDRFGHRAVTLVGVVGSMAAGWLLFNGIGSVTGQVLLSLLEGIFAVGLLYTNLYALLQRCVPAGHVGRASGVFVGFFYTPAAVSGYLFAALKGSLGWGGAALIELVLLPIAALIALALLTRSRPAAVSH
jgi:MFS family permease